MRCAAATTRSWRSVSEDRATEAKVAGTEQRSLGDEDALHPAKAGQARRDSIAEFG
jgi:hypothetical protein